MGRCMLSFAYSKNKMFQLVADRRVARGNWNGAGLPERFTVRTRIGMITLAILKSKTLKLGLISHF